MNPGTLFQPKEIEEIYIRGFATTGKRIPRINFRYGPKY